MAEWLRPLILSTLKTRNLTAVGLTLARVTCETSQVLLAGGQMVFHEDFPFSPHIAIDSAQNKWNLDGLLNQNKTRGSLVLYLSPEC